MHWSQDCHRLWTWHPQTGALWRHYQSLLLPSQKMSGRHKCPWQQELRPHFVHLKAEVKASGRTVWEILSAAFLFFGSILYSKDATCEHSLKMPTLIGQQYPTNNTLGQPKDHRCLDFTLIPHAYVCIYVCMHGCRQVPGHTNASSCIQAPPR